MAQQGFKVMDSDLHLTEPLDHELGPSVPQPEQDHTDNLSAAGRQDFTEIRSNVSTDRLSV